jgi:hypothetical protein
MRVCVILGVIKDSKVLQALSASIAQACEFYVCNAEWFTPVPGLGPELCLAFPRGPMGLCWCDSGTVSPICSGFGTGMWQWYKSAPVADIAVNRHHSGISSPESYRTSKYPQLRVLRHGAFCARPPHELNGGSLAPGR